MGGDGGWGGDGTEKKKLWAHTYHQTIYEADPSKDLEKTKCSNKVPKSVTHDVTRGWTDSSYYSI